MPPTVERNNAVLSARATALFREQFDSNNRQTDRMFACLMVVQWLAGMAAAWWISPQTWEGQYSSTHMHIWAAIILGAAIASFPVFLAIRCPGATLTRHSIAAGEMLSCGLLIHLMGGRIEAHFQYFVVLAFLAFYRDWRVLLTASAVAATDHFIRGYFWPESIYGVLVTSPWRAVEHTAWIVFEDFILVLLIRQNLVEIWNVARRRSELERVNQSIEITVEQRTGELSAEITERKRAELTLRESESKFRQLAENITDVFWITSPDFQKVLYVSPAYEQIWGHAAETLQTHPQQWTDAIVPAERERVLSTFTALATGSPSASAEFEIIRPDGTRRWIHCRAFPIRDATGHVVRITGIASDVTERKRVADELQESERRYSDMLRNLELISVMLDRDAKVTYCNDYLLRLTGWRREEVIGRDWFKLFVPTNLLDEMKQVFSELLDNRPSAWHHENEILTKAGPPLLIRWNNSVLCSALGEVIGLASIGEDITERKRIEARLFQSQKMETVGKLAGGIAHEFNSILTAIIGQSEYLASELTSESPMRKNALEIRQAAERAALLTNQLLAYGRKQKLQPEIVDLNVVLNRMQSTVHHLLGSEISMLIVSGKDLQSVNIDPGQMEQIVVNLSMNAADAMPNGGKFTLETANVTLGEDYVGPIAGLKAGEYVMLGVTDTGIGMSDDVKGRAFEPFFSTKGVGLGTGLGLATCFGIIKQSNGHITVYSEVGRGTTFKIYLPAVNGAETKPSIRYKVPKLQGGTETILLAEDDPSLLEMSSALLRRLGYTVLTAVDGFEALALKQQRHIGHIDLLLTDIVMPHMSGNELSQRIRMIYPRTKILLTSAYTENAVMHQGMLGEGVALLQKPFTPTALANRVREVLDN